MATVDWPTGSAFQPERMKLSASVAKSAWSAFFTGQVQSISHLADRLTCTVMLPPCSQSDAALREAFFMGLVSTGDWVRLGMKQRPTPLGTLRGTPTVAANASAGARTISVQTTAGATLLGGDALGADDQLLMAAYAGATADGSGVMSLPLVLPLRVALTSGDSLTWQSPTGLWQLAVDQIDFGYFSWQMQDALEIPLREVFA